MELRPDVGVGGDEKIQDMTKGLSDSGGGDVHSKP